MGSVHQKWLDSHGDETYALNWDLHPESLVWEIGGFEGRWAAQMSAKYDPRIEIFEPQDWAVGRMRTRFQDNPRIQIHPYGLWFMDCNLPLYHFETDGASLIDPGARSQIVPFKDIFLEMRGKEIDVCLMNIEGAEYLLLPYLIGLGLMRKIRFFWCQFHPFLEQADEREIAIWNGLKQTHDVIWDFYPSAVCWRRNEEAVEHQSTHFPRLP